ncbi:hypothetical protein MKW92_031181 [Papaver armeniacum]|nr:hypothetical protein MKW92_031181 [Papaver armeniacum]
MITGYAHNGRCELALTLFDGTTLQQSVSLTNAIVHMYASCGAIEDAYTAFRGMPHRSLISWNTIIVGFAKQGCRVEALGVFRWMLNVGCMVDLLSREGFLDAAQQLIQTIPMKPNDLIWGALLSGDHIVELEPDRAAGYLTLMDNVEKIKQRMVEMQVKKPSGRRDLAHENAPAIYNMASQIAHQSV